ncbi:hypothetical protein D8S78_11850 [Natrialba swarupiae]|nr:hypothetical protein [Natrialba swarupiae]
MPDDIEHRTKLEIAAGLVEHVVSADIEHGCVVADQNYGKSRSFRQKLRGLDEPYIMDVSPSSFSFVSEETELLRPEDSPHRKHPAYPETVSPETLEKSPMESATTSGPRLRGTKELKSRCPVSSIARESGQSNEKILDG